MKPMGTATSFVPALRWTRLPDARLRGDVLDRDIAGCPPSFSVVSAAALCCLLLLLGFASGARAFPGSEEAFQEAQPGITYQAGTRLRISDTDWSFVVPNGWKSNRSEDSPMPFVYSEPGKALGMVFPMVDATRDSIREQLSQPLSLLHGLSFVPSGTEVETAHTMGRSFQSEELVGRALAVFGPEQACVLYFLMGPADEASDYDATLERLAASTRFGTQNPNQASSAPSRSVEAEGDMVTIMAGTFLRGSLPGDGDPDEEPQRVLYLDGFRLDRQEVTNRRYRAFLQATGHRTPEHCCDPSYNLWDGYEIDASRLDHPVVNVDWHDAEAFCRWDGKRLPREAEWERAARGTHGRRFPWSDLWDRTRANGASYWANQDLLTVEAAKAWWAEEGAALLNQEEAHGLATLPEQALPLGATPEGLVHLAGNVWEWVADWYDPAYYAVAPERNPPGPASGEYKVLRGGSWLNHQAFLRGAVRDGSRPTMRNHGTGFRCAQDLTVTP